MGCDYDDDDDEREGCVVKEAVMYEWMEVGLGWGWADCRVGLGGGVVVV